MQIAKQAHHWIKPLAGAVAVIVGITTTVNVAAAKFNPGANFTFKTAILMSRIIGPQATLTIMGAPLQSAGINPAGLGLPSPGITVSGVFNSSTFGGIVTLVANAVIKYFSIPYYNTYAAPFINALGVGLLAGGVVGGLLDPDPSTMGSTGQPFLSYNPIQPLASGQQPMSQAPSSQAQPFLSVSRVRLHGR